MEQNYKEIAQDYVNNNIMVTTIEYNPFFGYNGECVSHIYDIKKENIIMKIYHRNSVDATEKHKYIVENYNVFIKHEKERRKKYNILERDAKNGKTN